MNKKIENILFFASTSVKPPKKGLEDILGNLPVTDFDNMRYNNVMKPKLTLPLVGILAIALIAFLAFGRTPSTSTDLPTTVTSGNIDSSLNQADNSVSKSLDQMDQDFKNLDQVQQEGDPNSL